MGLDVCAVPTAVLSAHTGYGDFVMRDLTDFIADALAHYKKLGVHFDCVYSGFLASAEQIDHCSEFFSYYGDALKVVDPVMGDGGRRYKTYTAELCAKMSRIVGMADIITPNLTEAAILLDEDYPQNGLSVSKVKSWLVRLSQLGPKTVVITGASVTDSGISCCGYDSATGGFWRVVKDYVPAQYSGTGDLYTAVLTGGLLSGDSLPIAMNRAASFTTLAVKSAYSYGISGVNGVPFESQLPWLTDYRELSDFESL